MWRNSVRRKEANGVRKEKSFKIALEGKSAFAHKEAGGVWGKSSKGVVAVTKKTPGRGGV